MVVLLSDYNLNSDGTYNTSCGRDINGNFNCSTMAFDSNNTQTYDENDSNNIGYFIKNTYTLNVTKLLFETKNITLPTAFQIAVADNQTFNYSDLKITNDWLLTTNYWTITKFTTNTYGVWIIYGINSALNGSGGSDDINYGARPVITTLKTNLLAN